MAAIREYFDGFLWFYGATLVGLGFVWFKGWFSFFDEEKKPKRRTSLYKSQVAFSPRRRKSSIERFQNWLYKLLLKVFLFCLLALILAIMLWYALHPPASPVAISYALRLYWE